MVNYTTIKEVRLLSGHRAKREEGIRIGTGDGSSTIFYIPKRAFIVDGNGDQIIDGLDYTVYVDGTAVTVDEVVTDQGKFTLNVAPADETAVTIDFFTSNVSDDEILHNIEHYSKLIERITNNVYGRDNITTDTFSGDGNKKWFEFGNYPVYQINSYSIDGTTTGLTEGEDYFLRPKTDRALWIEFYVPPVTDQNNVSITYAFGEEDALVSRWVKLNVARDIYRYEMGTQGNFGTYVLPESDPSIVTSSKSYSFYRLLGEEIKELQKQISGFNSIDVIDVNVG